MDRKGFMDIIQYEDVIVLPVIILVILVISIICNIYMSISFRRVLRDFQENKIDGLKIRIMKLEKFCKIFMTVFGFDNIKYMQDYLCYMDEIIDCKNRNEEKSLSEPQKKGKKNGWILLSVFLLALYVKWHDLPFKSMFSTYSSPEEAYASTYPDNELQLKLVGTESCLLIGSSLKNHDHLMVYEEDGHWKVDIDLNVIEWEDSLNLISYCYYQHNKEDNFLIINDLYDRECHVFDSCDSIFVQVDSKWKSVGQLHCVYIENYEEDYWVNVNGNLISLK